MGYTPLAWHWNEKRPPEVEVRPEGTVVSAAGGKGGGGVDIPRIIIRSANCWPGRGWLVVMIGRLGWGRTGLAVGVISPSVGIVKTGGAEEVRRTVRTLGNKIH